MKQKIVRFLKQETVLAASAILALLSSFVVHPSKAYLSYIDFRVLGILLSLMIIMAGFRKNGLFDRVGLSLLRRTKTVRQLCLVLVLLCFFLSMFITNDVALITFVPFTMMLLALCGKEALLMPVIVAQTIAANLGSMLMPVGNPQNLYLYNLGGFTLGGFIATMLPYSAISLAGLLFFVCLICGKNEALVLNGNLSDTREKHDGRETGLRNAVYLVLFVLCLLVVAKLLPYALVLAAVVAAALVLDRQVLLQVDYSLLFTFSFFFIFTGNIGRMDAARQWLQSMVDGRAVWMGVAVSQIISNVPAALLLSGFTTDYEGLLLGVNIGGLGTLIASMASLISYKIYAREYDRNKGKYLLYFTVANIAFLAVLTLGVLVLRGSIG